MREHVDYGIVVRIIESYLSVLNINRTGVELIPLIGNENSSSNYNALFDYVSENYSDISELKPQQQIAWLAQKITEKYDSLVLLH